MNTQAISWLEKLGESVNRNPRFVVVFCTAIYFALTLPTSGSGSFLLA